MATTTERGIAVLETTDPVTHANINLISATVDTALGEQEPRQIYTVANVAERTVLAGTFVPTANKPLYVHRVNAGSGRQLERTINGTTWEVIPTEQDTGWIDLPNEASVPWTGFDCRYRARNGVVYVNVYVASATADMPQVTTTVATMPTQFRPSLGTYLGYGSQRSVPGFIRVATSGNIQIDNRSGIVDTPPSGWVTGSGSYVL